MIKKTKSKLFHTSIAHFLSGAALIFLIAADVSAGGIWGNPGVGSAGNPGVLPSNSMPYGKSYGEWSAKFWQWLYSLPPDNHPVFDTGDCSEGQVGPVWFLGGTFAFDQSGTGTVGDPIIVSGEEDRDCHIPAGKAILFPIINAECNTIVDYPLMTEEDLRDCANELADGINPANLQATVDGEPVEHLGLYRVESPLFTIGPLPDPNIFEVDPSVTPTADAVGDGYYVMLAPLSAGAHQIHFAGQVLLPDEMDPTFIFSLDINYNVTVDGH